VELYRDRPPEEWPRTPEGELAMFSRRLDLEDLLREAHEEMPVRTADSPPRDL
jgi:catechol 2,3-dioxygenase